VSFKRRYHFRGEKNWKQDNYWIIHISPWRRGVCVTETGDKKNRPSKRRKQKRGPGITRGLGGQSVDGRSFDITTATINRTLFTEEGGGKRAAKEKLKKNLSSNVTDGF